MLRNSKELSFFHIFISYLKAPLSVCQIYHYVSISSFIQIWYCQVITASPFLCGPFLPISVSFLYLWLSPNSQSYHHIQSSTRTDSLYSLFLHTTTRLIPLKYFFSSSYSPGSKLTQHTPTPAGWYSIPSTIHQTTFLTLSSSTSNYSLVFKDHT